MDQSIHSHQDAMSSTKETGSITDKIDSGVPRSKDVQFDEQHTFINQDSFDEDSDHEYDDMFTQDHAENSFTFGSEAGLFTQAAEDSQEFEDSDDDDDLEMKENHISLEICDDENDESKDRGRDGVQAPFHETKNLMEDTNCQVSTVELDSEKQDDESESQSNENEGESIKTGFTEESLNDRVTQDMNTNDDMHESNVSNVECTVATAIYESSLNDTQMIETALEEEEKTGFTMDDEDKTQSMSIHTPTKALDGEEKTGFTLEDEDKTQSMDLQSPVEGSKNDDEQQNGPIGDEEDRYNHTESLQSGFTENSQSQTQTEDMVDHPMEKMESKIENEKSQVYESNDKRQPEEVETSEEKKDEDDAKNDNHESVNVSIPQIYTGDTQSLPSQFPLTLDAEEKTTESLAEQNSIFETKSIDATGGTRIEENESQNQNEEHSSSPEPQETIPKDISQRQSVSNSSTKSKHVAHSETSTLLDDSFCAGSTQNISPLTTEANVCKNSLSESIAKDKSLVNLSEEMEASKDTNVQLESIVMKPQDSEKTEMETDDNNGNCKVVLPSSQDKDRHETETPHASIPPIAINPTASPEYLSYPQDYLKESSMKEKEIGSLSITPQSQILLEPSMIRKGLAQQSIIEKVDSMKTIKATRETEDIDNSSDEEEEKESSRIENESVHGQKEAVLNLSPKKKISSGTSSDDGWIDSTRMKRKSSSNMHEVNVMKHAQELPYSQEDVDDDDDDDSFDERQSRRSGTHASSSPCLTDTQQDDIDVKITSNRVMTDTRSSPVNVKASIQRKSLCNESYSSDESNSDSDGDDDMPLNSLIQSTRNIRRGNKVTKTPPPRHQKKLQSDVESESSEDEMEFEDPKTSVSQSQSTKDVKSQLRKLENLDVQALTAKILKSPFVEGAELKAEVHELKRENKKLKREASDLKKQLSTANSKLKDKNSIIASLTAKLDELQPLIDAVQQLQMPKSKTKKSTPKSSPQNHSKKKKSKQDEAFLMEKEKESNLETPQSKKTLEVKADQKEAVKNVVTASISKKTKVRNVRGNMTFSNLWKVLKTEFGWKYRNGPMPYAGQVYVPPDGSVAIGARVGVDFYEADDLIWKKAEELGIIEEQCTESQELREEAYLKELEAFQNDESGADDDELHSNANKVTNQVVVSKRDIATNGVGIQNEDSSSDEDEFDNEKLFGKLGTMTELSLVNASLLIKDFIEIGPESHFRRDLFNPLWNILSQEQASVRKEIAWSYCKSKKSKGAGMLGRDYWFIPPFSKGADGDCNIDYFTTEEEVVAHIIKEVKGYSSFVKTYEIDVNDLEYIEVKLSRSIEEALPYDDVKSTNPSQHRQRQEILTPENSRKRKVTSAPVKISAEKGSESKSSRKSNIRDVAAEKVPQKGKKKQKSPPWSPEKARVSVPKLEITHSPSRKRIATPGSSRKSTPITKTTSPKAFSQKTMEGAEILMQLNKSLSEDSVYENIATASGVKELLKFRRRTLNKRNAPETPRTSPSSRKRVKISPSEMCHMTQNEDDSQEIIYRSPRNTKNGDKNALPLKGLTFFGSGVTEKVKKHVSSLGGTFINDVSEKHVDAEKVQNKLFFLSDVKSRRTHKYILACSLGVPMLHYRWIEEMKESYERKRKEGGTVISAFNSELYTKYRLPLGLSNSSGLFHLQRARHARKWVKATNENGTAIFSGLNMILALEQSDAEKKWANILKVSGANILHTRDVDRKDMVLNIILVDSIAMPPHCTAMPSRVSKVLNKASSSQPNALILDLSWVTQCIVRRKLIDTDEDKRFKVNMSLLHSLKESNEIEIFSMKVKKAAGLTRFEVGDSVSFARNGDECEGRIVSISHNMQTRTNTVEVKVLERHDEYKLMDGGQGTYSVKISSDDLQGQIVILNGKDFEEVAWSEDSNVFLQMKI